MPDDRTISGEFAIPSDHAASRPVMDAVAEALASCRFGDRDIFQVKLALEEALANAIKHGNQLDPRKQVRVAFTATPDRVDLRVVDEGPGFDPDDLPDPTDPDNMERHCGRGVFLIRHYMTTAEYKPPGNVLEMSKVRSPDDD